MERVKTKLARITAFKTGCAIVRSKSRWYEFEKRNHRKKHINTLKKQNESTISCPKEIQEQEAKFFS